MSDQSPPCLSDAGHVKARPNNGSYPVTPNRFDYQRCMEMNENGAKHVDEDGDGRVPKSGLKWPNIEKVTF